MFSRKVTRFQGVSSPSQLAAAEEDSQRRGLLRALSGIGFIGNPFFVIAIFSVAFAALGFMYYQQWTRESGHLAAINSAQASLSSAPDDPQALQTALDGWTAALEAADEMRIEPQFDSILLAGIMDVANQTGANLISAGLQSDGVATISENNYLATPIKLKVSGSIDVIRDFIGRLEAGAVVALEVQESQITLETGRYLGIVSAAVFSQPESLDQATAPSGGKK